MINLMLYPVVFIAGGVTAFLYLWILKFSVNQIAKGKTGVPFTLFGFFIRLALCALCFYLVSLGGRFDRVLVCLAGFMIVHFAGIKFVKRNLP